MTYHRSTYGHEKTEWVGQYGVEMTAMGSDGWTVGTVGKHALGTPMVFLLPTHLDAEIKFQELLDAALFHNAADALGVDMYIVAPAPGGTS